MASVKRIGKDGCDHSMLTNHRAHSQILKPCIRHRAGKFRMTDRAKQNPPDYSGRGLCLEVSQPEAAGNKTTNVTLKLFKVNW